MPNAKTANMARRRHLPTLLFILSLLVLFPPSVPAASPSSAQKVLVLGSYKSTSPVAYQWARGLESAFGANPGRPVELIYEHLDLTFLSDERYALIPRS